MPERAPTAGILVLAGTNGAGANYHRHVVAKETFARNDVTIWSRLWQWATRRHPNKGARWVKEKYFQTRGARHSVFAATKKREDGMQREVLLLNEGDTPIQRHVKIKSDANPHDPQWEQYFEARWGKKMLNSMRGRKKLYRGWSRQDGTCPVCQERLTKDSPWTVQHIVKRTDGGTDATSNTLMLHLTCATSLAVGSITTPRSC